MNNNAVELYIVYRRAIALKLSINVFICFVLMLGSIYYLKSNFLAFFFGMAMVIPVFFFKIILNKNRRKVLIDITKDALNITIISPDGDTETANEYFLSDIKTYNIQFPNRRFVSIRFNLINGKSFQYSFLQEKGEAQTLSADELLQRIHLTIIDHNKDLSDLEKIHFQPSFLATRAGLVCIICLSGLYVIAIYLHVLFSVKSAPITLFLGFGLLIQVILKRKSDIAYYNKMK